MSESTAPTDAHYFQPRNMNDLHNRRAEDFRNEFDDRALQEMDINHRNNYARQPSVGRALKPQMY